MLGSNVGIFLFGLITSAAAAESPPPLVEKTLESGLVTLTLEKVAACTPAADAASATPPAAPGAPPAKTWVGFAVRTRAKAPEVFLTARDFTLEQGGVILQPRHIDPPRLAGCTPLLKPLQLKPGQGSAGFVVFEVPNGFRTSAAAAGAAPLVLAFKPTRWGGAKRLEFAVPSCLDACEPGKPAAKKRVRNARSVTPANRR